MIVPTVLIVTYTALSLRSSQTSSIATTPSPLIRLLVPALFTVSIPFFLFSSTWNSDYASFCLLPMGLMMALRGGKEEVKSENETWELGVLLNNVATFR